MARNYFPIGHLSPYNARTQLEFLLPTINAAAAVRADDEFSEEFPSVTYASNWTMGSNAANFCVFGQMQTERLNLRGFALKY